MPTFTSIIDADHDAINTAALRLSRLLRAPTAAAAQRRQQLALLHDVTWRLIRHDLSEELVLRPALIAHMGAAGLAAAAHDRDVLLRQADAALYAAKRTRKGTAQTYQGGADHRQAG